MADVGGSGTPARRGTTPKPLHDDRPPRHYPLDIPLPFNRYEHRFSAHDIMVHRIMKEFMNPTKVPADIFDSYVRFPSAFKTIHADISQDLRCLQHMLVTSYDRAPAPEWHPITLTRPSPHAECCGILHETVVVEGPRKEPPRLGDQVMDLVRRYYFERDNAALRAWITSLDAFSVHNRSKAQLVGYQMHNRDRNPPGFLLRFDPKESGRGPLIKHRLTRLRLKTAIQERLPLYDGGVFMRHLRRQMDSRALNGTIKRLQDFRWETGVQQTSSYSATANWPGEDGTMRFLILPNFGGSRIAALQQSDQTLYKLDVSRNAGRGRNRDGIWSTGQAARWGESNSREGRYGRGRRRCTSEPPPGTFTHTILGQPGMNHWKLVVIYPSMTLSQLDRRSRRRSLSRTRIEEMFDWDVDLAAVGAIPTPPGRGRIACENCGSQEHHISACESPCGFCGAPNPNFDYCDFSTIFKDEDNRYNKSYFAHQMARASRSRHGNPHTAPQCPVAPQNRCKCLRFPFHVAARCGIPCRRNCGKRAVAAPGSFRHPNAMLCRSRCCMCGLKGHSGKECRLQRCRCGGAHLGQDCSWKPECKVRECGRYWCGLHCRECGSPQKPFIAWRCIACAGEDAKMPEETRGRPRRRRRGDRKESPVKERTPEGTPGREVCSGPAVTLPLIQPLPPQPSRDHPLTPPSLFGGPRVPREGVPRDKHA